MIGQLRFLLQLTHAQRIARRYFVTNGFDGALTMMGLTIGFYTAEPLVPTQVVISACLGAAVALAVSGLASAYVSESAEREKELRELEQAVVGDLQDTAHGRAARTVPLLIATVNGLAPLSIALFIMLPLWLEEYGVALPLSGLECAILLAFISLFLLGAFLGTVSGRFWLWSALRTLAVALLTGGIIFLINA
jgi:predicted membrane protein (TIGR00267 family)